MSWTPSLFRNASPLDLFLFFIVTFFLSFFWLFFLPCEQAAPAMLNFVSKYATPCHGRIRYTRDQFDGFPRCRPFFFFFFSFFFFLTEPFWASSALPHLSTLFAEVPPICPRVFPNSRTLIRRPVSVLYFDSCSGGPSPPSAILYLF